MLSRRAALMMPGLLALAPLPAMADPKTISLWHLFGYDTDIIFYGIKAFNESQSNYKIEPRLVPYTQINAELIKAIAAGSPPDLVVFNGPVVPSFASQGQLTDLTDRVTASKTINLDAFYPGARASSRWRGRYYSVAREVNTTALFYNEDMFHAHGLDPDKPPQTWSTLMSAAETLKDPAKSVYGFGFSAHSSDQGVFTWLPFLWQAGGDIDKLDQPAATAALQYWVDLVQKGIASRDVISQLQLDVMNVFMAGNTAIAIGGPWDLPRLQKDAKVKWRVTSLPVKDDKNIKASALGGFHFAIPTGATQVDGAFQVIEAMLDPALFDQGWKSGVLAPRTDIVLKNPEWPDAYTVFRGELATARPRGPHPQWPDISRPIQIAIQEALTGSKPAGQALQDAAQKIRPILTKTPL